MIQSSPSDPSMALSQICRHRRRRSNDLIRKTPEFRRDRVYERDGCPGRTERDFENLKVVVGSDGGDVLRGVHATPRTGGDNRCQGSRSDRPEAGLPLTTVGPAVIRHSSHEHHEEHHRRSHMTLISRSRSGRPGQWTASGSASDDRCSARFSVRRQRWRRPRIRSTATAHGPGPGQLFLPLKLPTGPVPAAAFWFCRCCWDQARNSASAGRDGVGPRPRSTVPDDGPGFGQPPRPRTTANGPGPGQRTVNTLRPR